MSVQDLLNYAVIDGGQAPTNVASDTGDIGAMLKYLVERAKETTLAANISPSADANGSLAERIAYLQALAPTVAGVIQHPRDWVGGAGYEFWAASWGDWMDDAASANLETLTEVGWSMATSSIGNGGSGGDFLSLADDDGSQLQAAVGAWVSSPFLFGGGVHAAIAQRFLGQAPTKLCLDQWLRWNNITGSSITYAGLANARLLANVATAGIIAAVRSNGSFYVLESPAGSIVSSVAVSTTVVAKHTIKVGPSTTQYLIDDVSQGTMPSVVNDVYPAGFVLCRETPSGTNVTARALRVYYEV